VAGVAGVFTREGSIEVNHAFRQWLLATVKFTAATDDYVGSVREDRRFALSAALTYKLMRELHLKTEYRREWMHSTVPNVDYVADVYLVGLRLQR